MSPKLFESSAPTIEEMRHQLTKTDGRDYFRPIANAYQCSECQSERADWWMIRNGQRLCNKCAVP